MDEWVNDTSYCENTSYDRTDIDEELEDVLLLVRVMNCDWGDLVVEHDQVLMIRVVSFIRRIELKCFCDKCIS